MSEDSQQAKDQSTRSQKLRGLFEQFYASAMEGLKRRTYHHIWWPFIQSEGRGLKSGWHVFTVILVLAVTVTGGVTWYAATAWHSFKSPTTQTSQQTGWDKNHRLLSGDQKEAMLDELRRIPLVGDGVLSYPDHDDVAFELAEQIAAIFVEANIPHIQPNSSYTERGKLTRDVWFLVKDANNPPDHLAGIKRAFEAAGFKAPVYDDPLMERSDFIFIEIGRTRGE